MIFARWLAKCGMDITLETRDERIINGRTTEVFVTFATVKAIITTLSGKSVFDDTNTEQVATHRICIAYLPGVTSELWVKLGTKRIKALTVENCCEKNEQLILMCTERGDDARIINQA